jgi:hypothetical protein
MLDTQSCKYTLGICNTYCFSTATVVALTRLNVTLHVRCRYFSLWWATWEKCYSIRFELRLKQGIKLFVHPLLCTLLYFIANRLTDVPSLFWITVRRCDVSSFKVHGVAGCYELGWWCVLFGGAVRGLPWDACHPTTATVCRPGFESLLAWMLYFLWVIVQAESRGPERRSFCE